MKKIEIIVKEDGTRIDKYITDYLEDYTRNFIKKLISSKAVLVNGIAIKPSYNVKSGDTINILLPTDEVGKILAEDKELEIIYEDDYIAVLNKPSNLIVHPTETIREGTLVNRLLFRFKNLSDLYQPFRPGIVHRLDKDTSGLIIIAKDNDTHEKLKSMFQNREIEKHYVAIVHGKVDEEVVIEKPIGRDIYNRTKMAVVDDGKYAKSILRPICYNDEYSLVEVLISTGRTHQIRVHLSSLHHPVLGDKTYGIKKEKINTNRQMLHAFYLKFNHPILDKRIELIAPLHDDYIETIKKCNLDYECYKELVLNLED